MIKLRDIMSEGKYAASEADMKKWFDECMMLSDKLKYVGGGWQGRNFSYNLLSVPPTQDELDGAREIIVDPY